VTAVPEGADLRGLTEADRGWIVTSWVESYHAGNAAAHTLRWREYREPMRRRTRALLDSASVVVCGDRGSDAVYGFACGTDGVLHYVYVAHLRRRTGLATALLAELERVMGSEIESYDHVTRAGARLVEGRGWANATRPVLEMLAGGSPRLASAIR
jgi:GNAT superfamily N-acetyltransferase